MNNHRVLIGNHDAVAANRAAATLRSVGYTVTTVTTSDDAIRVASETPPALLIINPVMRGLSGFEAARHIVSRQHCKLLFLTDLAGDSDFEQLCRVLGREGIQSAALPGDTSNADLIDAVRDELGSPIIQTDAQSEIPAPGSISPSPTSEGARKDATPSPASTLPGSFTAQNVEPYSPIFAIATSKLYQTNAFRLTGTQVTASSREIKRAYQEFTLNKKLGRPWVPSCFIPHLDNPTDDEREQAFTHLSNPEPRLLQELFWFWADGDEDEAFSGIQVKESSLPAKEWRRRSKSSDVNGVATHNLAVLNHLMALQCEETHLLGQRVVATDYWKEAFRDWQAVIQNSRFWDRFIDRIRDLDDPRVTVDLAGRIWASLPEAILYINAANAVRAAEAGDFSEAARQRQLMYGSGLGIQTAEKALDRALSPLLQHLTLLCNEARSQVESDPNRGIEIIQVFDKAKSPLLKTLNCLVGAEDARRGLAHDEVASAIRSCLIDYVNETNAWAQALPFFENSLALAKEPTLRARIADDITVLQGNLDYQRRSRESGQAATAGSHNTSRTTTARPGASDVGSGGVPASGALRIGYAIGHAWKSMPALGKVLLVVLVGALFFVLVGIYSGNDSGSSQTPSTQVGSSPGETPAAAPASSQDSSPTTVPSTNEATSPSSYVQRTPAGTDNTEIDALKAEIEDSKAKLAEQESQARVIESEIDEYKSSIDSDKSLLEQMERDNDAGVDVDHDQYERVRRRHNQNVASYNAAIDRHKSLIQDYHELLAETNEKVDKYNSMVKSQ